MFLSHISDQPERRVVQLPQVRRALHERHRVGPVGRALQGILSQEDGDEAQAATLWPHCQTSLNPYFTGRHH